MKARAYLDWNASAPLLPAARAAMLEGMDMAANASSVHAEGRAARRMVEAARAGVAALVGAKQENVIFTSGASEAAQMALTPDYRMGRSPLNMSRLYVSATDHPCILGGGRFPSDRIGIIGVDADGVLDLGMLSASLAKHDRSEGTALVALHLANNETGVIQPVAEIGRIAREAGAVIVLDAVQGAGRIPLDISAGYADFMILSAHKIGGPKGIGALVAASDLLMPAPLISGGGQEKGHRGGTENVPAITGFGAAALQALSHLGEMDAVRRRRDAIEADILALAPDAIIYGRNAERLPNTSFFALPGLKAETAQIAFDLAGIALSAGSACSSGRVGPSHVLEAMGHDGESGLRVSIGPATTERDVELFRSALKGIVARRAARKEAA
ncbi:MAG TPA: cysteine desulfurase family protein [Rhizobiaceae bacterium]|nr:cysteine desulfurase family protein [Rhizobiaceae bacterium]